MSRAAVPKRSRVAAADRQVDRIISSKLRLFGVAVLGAKVAALPLFFDPALDMPFVVSKALVSHGLAYLLAAVIAGLLVRFGMHFFVRSWLHFPVVAFLLVSAAATIFAANLDLALYGTHARMLGFGTILDLGVLYFAVVLLVRSRADAVAVVTAALGASALVLAYELAQWLGKDPFRWNIDSFERPFSTLGQATALAQYLTVLCLGALTFGLFPDRMHPRVRVALLFYAALLFIGAAATGTRSVLLGWGAASTVLMLLAWRARPSWRARAVSTLVAVSAALALGAFLFVSPLGARLAATIVDTPREDDEVLARLEPSAAGRLALYEIGLNMLRERPILGYGPDNYTVGVPRYRPEGAPQLILQSLATSAHSWAIQVATSTGLLGLACFLAVVVVALGLALLRGFQVAAAAGAVMIAAFLGTGLTTVNEFGTEWLFWASAGAIAASTVKVRRPLEPGQGRRSPKRRAGEPDSQIRRLVAAILLLAAGAAVFAGFGALSASRLAYASQQARLAGERQLAVELGLRATRSDSGRPTYWHILGLAYASTLRWSDATVAFGRASTLAPYDVRYMNDLAAAELILANSGDSTARPRARALGERAVQTDPNNPRAHLTRAVVMQVLGDLPEALRSSERALALDPNSANDRLYVTASQVMIDSGRAGDAVPLARQGLAVFGQTSRSVAIRIELARALLATGKLVEAVAELDLALAIQPNEPTAMRLRAEIRARLPN